MAKPMKSVINVASEGVALEGVLEGARRATGDTPSSAAPADPEVVAVAHASALVRQACLQSTQGCPDR